MGDNIHLGDRDGVRTPMQWSPDRNGGFSRADPASLVLPPIMDPLYGFDAVNVEAQAADPHSLLNWTRRMLAVRKRHRAFGRGAQRFLYPANRKCSPICASCQAATARTRPSSASQPVAHGAGGGARSRRIMPGRVPVELLGGSVFPPIGQLTYLLTLPPYGFFWFQLAAETQVPAWHAAGPRAAAGIHHPGGAARACRSARPARRGACWRPRCCPPTCPSAAGSRPRTSACSAPASPTPCRCRTSR